MRDRDQARRSTGAHENRGAWVSALKRYRKRLRRKLEAMQGDLKEANRAGDYRRYGEILLAYLKQVPTGAGEVSLPSPADPDQKILIPLDPRLKAHESASRYFKRAAKAERALHEVPPRISATEAELAELDRLLERAQRATSASQTKPVEAALDPETASDASLDRDLEDYLNRLPAAAQRAILPAALAEHIERNRVSATRRAGKPLIPARLSPRRLRSSEGWEVLIGRTNEGNDYLTHRLARGEDYWFHVHGAAGSHVILRRGKGKNEPSKRTLAEVAGWAAFYSQARTAGKAPVLVTRKKYVRKPRQAPPGLAVCEREKTLLVRPKEPPRQAAQDWAGDEQPARRRP